MGESLFAACGLAFHCQAASGEETKFYFFFGNFSGTRSGSLPRILYR
jgi:hypothetical protein